MQIWIFTNQFVYIILVSAVVGSLMPEIRLEKLVKRYGAVQVLHGIDLHMAENEFTVLVGPSGCGKSTTLRMLAGLESVSDGDILMGAKSVRDLDPKDRDIAMVFQDYALYPHMNVARNMSFSLRLKKVPQAQIDRKVRGAWPKCWVCRLI